MNTVLRPEMKDHPMAIAAREVNKYSEEHGLKETCKHYGIKVEDLVYMAEQRALRALYARAGINLDLKESQILSLSPREEQIVELLTPAYMDGLLIGWRAKEIEDSTNHNTGGVCE